MPKAKKHKKHKDIKEKNKRPRATIQKQARADISMRSVMFPWQVQNKMNVLHFDEAPLYKGHHLWPYEEQRLPKPSYRNLLF